MWNIRNKILLIFLPVVLIPLISVSTFFAIHTAKSLKQSKIDELQSITKRKVEMAVSFVRSIDYDIRILGKNKFLSNLTDAVAGEDTEQINHWKSELEMLFTTFAESKKIYDQMCYIDKSGRELVRVDLLYRDYADIVTTKDLQD
ncbi:MAG: hypothetical protein ACE5H1_12300, partial [Thermodesulfobacteriota bacterium]